MPRLRLEAEIIRDAMLAVAGTLDRTVGGPAIFPFIDPDLFEKSSRRDWKGLPDNDPVNLAAQPLCVLEAQHPLPDVRGLRSAESGELDRSAQPHHDRAASADPDEQPDGVVPGRQVCRTRSRRSGRRRWPPGRGRVCARTGPRRRCDRTRSRGIAFVRQSDGGLTEFCHLLFNLNEFVYRP